MKQNDDLYTFAYAGGIIIACVAAAAVVGQAPAGFFLGCVAAVFYIRMKDDEE